MLGSFQIKKLILKESCLNEYIFAYISGLLETKTINIFTFLSLPFQHFPLHLVHNSWIANIFPVTM